MGSSRCGALPALLSMALVAAGLLALLALTSPARAAVTFTVNSTGDGTDADTTDGVCGTGLLQFPSGQPQCTLRAAIQQANATAGADTIEFSVSEVALSVGGRSEEAAETGDLDITGDVTVDGGGAIVRADANFDDRLFHVVSPAKATIKGLTVTGGRETDGGGIYVAPSAKLALSGSTVQGSAASDSTGGVVLGGGILNEGTISISRSTIRGNKSENLGSGDSYGGGLFNGGPATITDSTFVANATDGPASSGGGGIFNDSDGTLTLTNVTVSGNSASGSNGGNFGGGVHNGAGNLTLANATLNGNSAASGANLSSQPFNNSYRTYVQNTIVANPLGGGLNCSGGGVQMVGYNLVYPGNTCFASAGPGTIEGQDPKLGALTDNGGPTPTHALLAGSPAIDAADNAACPAADARGLARPRDGDGNGAATCDIGAFEKGFGIVGVTPPDGATGVARDTDVTVSFSEKMDPSTLAGAFRLYREERVRVKKRRGWVWVTRRTQVSAQVGCDSPCRTAKLEPAAPLAANSKYWAAVSPGAEDTAGNALPKNYPWTFTTGST